MKVKEIIYRACLYFTVITLVFYSVGMLVSDSASFKIPTLTMLFGILLFCVVLSVVRLIFDAKKVPGAVRYLLHFAATGAAFAGVFIFMSGVYRNGTSIIIGLSAFILLYALIMGGTALARAAYARILNSRTEYKSQFDNSKDKDK